jgi:HAMP domain-containing protein
MPLKTLFAAALGLTLLVCYATVAALLYRSAVSQAAAETLHEARVVLAAATAARTYNATHITPLLTADTSSSTFHRESVPSFAAQRIMSSFSEAFPEYRYSERALNPTNVEDLARSWQIDIIQNFRAQPAVEEVSGNAQDGGRRVTFIAQPIHISDPNCLICHSQPKAAPAAMIEAYNTGGGFGWKLDEIIGAKFVTVSADDRLNSNLRSLFWFLIALGCVLVIALMVVMGIVHGAVARHARRLASQADRLSTGDPAGDELAETGPAEFRTLARAVNRLHRSLAAAVRELTGRQS